MFGLVILLGGGSVAAREALEIHYVDVNGLKVPLASAFDWAQAYKDRWESTPVTLLVDGWAHRRTRAELGALLPMEELAEALGRDDRVDADDPVAIRWSAEVDHAKLLEAVFALREQVTTPRDEGDDGESRRTLDLHASLKILKKELPASGRVMELPMRTMASRKIAGGSRPGSFAQLLARHVSEYRATGRSWSRGHNIEQAANALDGIIIEPNGELSFNEVVGDRSFQRGFMPANEIARGRVVDGIGGGVCQVATALHAAALLSGFEIVEHYVHSKRPRYAGRGLDSAVAWGLKDLRIRNPFATHARIRAEAQSGTLTVGLWSGRKPPEVEITTEVSKGTIDATDRPLIIVRTRIIHWNDGPKTDTELLNYPAEPKD